jgi:hypothetical protein
MRLGAYNSWASHTQGGNSDLKNAKRLDGDLRAARIPAAPNYTLRPSHELVQKLMDQMQLG